MENMVEKLSNVIGVDFLHGRKLEMTFGDTTFAVAFIKPIKYKLNISTAPR